MITFACACGKTLKVRDELAGKKVKCPGCGQVMSAPQTVRAPVTTDQPTVTSDPSIHRTTTATPVDQSHPTSADETIGLPAAGSSTSFLAPPQGPGEIGRLGAYRVLRVLGHGGMGMVLEAEDPQLKRRVALKVMLPGHATDATLKQRFLREAQAAAALEHDHIITIYQVGEDHGVPFLAMPLLKGESLAACLKREGKLPLAEAVRIAHEIANGLAAAHDAGLLHRDIKPANIWLETRSQESGVRDHATKPRDERSDSRGSGRVKILDFGLARPVGDDIHLTGTGVIVGTPAYMAPEQARSEKVDHRADLYSLGCVLYQMITGQLPVKGKDTFSMLTALAVDTPVHPREHNPAIPAELCELTMQLLAKNPDARPATARDVQARLKRREGEAPAEPRSNENTTMIAGAGTAGVLTSRRNADATQTMTLPAPKPKRLRTPLLVLVMLGVLLPLGILGYLFGGQIIRIVTNQGELIIVVDDPTIELKVTQNGIIAYDKTSKREFTLTAGKGEIEVLEKDGVKLTTKKFQLTRGGKTTIKVTLEELADARKPKDPDRRAAEWVLSIGGHVWIKQEGKPVQVKAAADLPRQPFQLDSVDLHDNKQASDAGLAHFKDCKNLMVLTLWGTPVSDLGLANFKNCRNLTDLGLGNTKVSDAALADFAKDWPNLTGIGLNATPVSDTGLGHLMDCKNLTLLFLSKTQVTEPGVKKLAAALPGCKIESDFGVFGPTLSPDRRAAEWVLEIGGAVKIEVNGVERGIPALADLPKEAFELTEVYLGNNLKVTDVGLACFKDCKKITLLGLNGTPVTDVGMVHFEGSTKLAVLDLTSTQVGDTGLGYFRASKNLTRLYLGRSKVTNGGLAHLKDCQDLAVVHVFETQVSDAGLAHFKKSRNIQEIDLDNTSIDEKGLEVLNGFKKLTLLRVKKNMLTEAGVKKLAAALPGCRIESDFGAFGPIDPNRRVAEAIISSGGSLFLDDGKTELKKTADIPEQPFKIRSIHLAGPHIKLTTELMAQIATLKPVFNFDLGNSIAKDEMLVPLAEFDCEILNLGTTQITDAALASLRNMKKLKRLILSDLRTELGKGLSHLEGCEKLELLFLNRNIVTQEGVQALSRLKQLKFLNVKQTKLTEADFKKLAAALPECKVESDLGDFGPIGITPAKGWVELLPLIDAEKDQSLDGQTKFARTKDGIEFTGGTLAQVWQVPVAIHGDYEIEMIFTPHAEKFVLGPQLHIGKGRSNLIMTPESIGLHNRGKFNTAGVESGKRHTLMVKVTLPAGEGLVAVQIDGRTPGPWQGKTDDMTVGADHVPKHPIARTLGLYSYLDPKGPPPQRWTLHSFKLRMLTGDARIARPEDAKKLGS
jgi:serine/threonine protein kinase/Leucine-rich repeat (LRR) protein